MQGVINDCTRLNSGIDSGIRLESLVQAAQGGSHYAFEALQNIYSQRLYKQIVAITRHHEDAEDALQDALCKAFVALPLFERRCHIYTWMSRIAINCALMKVRKRKKLQEFSLNDQDHSDDQESIKEFSDHSWSPEEICRAEEWLRRVIVASQTLDPISRRILMMRVNNDSSLEEIADALDVSVSAAKARLYRARHSLRAFFPEPV
jgi:RNA polymerase sigma-70 factor (ECF subfamily)